MKLWKLAVAATAVAAIGMSMSCKKKEFYEPTAAAVIAKAPASDAATTPLQALGPRFTLTFVAKGGEVNVLLLHDERGCDYLVTSSIYAGNSMAMSPLMEINPNSNIMPQRQVCAGR